MLDKERVLAKIDELESYKKEIEEIYPKDYGEYKSSKEKKRSIERLLHISIECIIDICSIITAGMRLGLPTKEEDLFEKLKDAKVISDNLAKELKELRAFRNILVHRYGYVDDELVYTTLKQRINIFTEFKKEILKFIEKK